MPKKRVRHFSFLVHIFFKVVWSLVFFPTGLVIEETKTTYKKIANKKVLVKMTVRSNVDIQSSWKNA